MRERYKVLTERYNTIYENNSRYMGFDTAEIERLQNKIITSDTFEDFKDAYEKLFTLQREALKIMPSPPYVAIYAFVNDKPELGGPSLKGTPGETLYDATTYLNSYFELTNPMYKDSQYSRGHHVKWAEDSWNQWYTAYKLWRDARAELYKNNPGINIDI